MQQVLDLHIHSRYSRACSKDLTLENLDKACRTKGVDIIATGDFTHPQWFDALTNLTPSPSPYKGEGGKTYLLAWTTTPWTLIGNVALSVGEKIKYSLVKYESNFYIVAKERAE